MSITEEECERRIKLALRDHEHAMREMHEKLLAAEFRAAVAEWAVAGIAGQGVRIQIDREELLTNKGIDLAHYLGRSTAAQMLNAAELAFRDHAALWELRARVPPYAVTYRSAGDPKPPPKESWPLPYKVPK
jgi:hypothetical protein